MNPRLIPILAMAIMARATVAQDAAWSDLPPLPVAISNNAVASVVRDDGTATIYSIGGITSPHRPPNITPLSYALDLPGGAWRRIADEPLLNGRAKIGASAVAIDGRVYLVGGYSVAGLSETTEKRLFEYDPEADAWVGRADVPVEVDDTVVGVYQDRYLYLVSGWHGPVRNNVPNVQVYDTRSDSWTQATPIPDPLPGLFGHAGAIVGDRIVYMDGVRTVGGFRISARAFVGRIDPTGSGDVDAIDWREIAPHPGLPTYRAAASQSPTPNGRMLLVGGTDNPYNFSGIGYDRRPSTPLDQVISLDPITGVWNTLDVAGKPLPTMDHRGLVPVPGGWAIAGGMIAPRTATNRVRQLTLLPCRADLDGDGHLGIGDFLGFQDAFASGNPAADINGDAIITVADFFAFVVLFAGGCP